MTHGEFGYGVEEVGPMDVLAREDDGGHDDGLGLAGCGEGSAIPVLGVLANCTS